jgi:hypothetical protein
MEEIRWERLNPAEKAVRTGFDSLFTEHNGVQLYVVLSYYRDLSGESKNHLELRWSASKRRSDGVVLLSAGAWQVFSADVADQNFRKVFDLFKRRAEAIANSWVEE